MTVVTLSQAPLFRSLKAGVQGNCIRVLCPLTIEDAVLDEALEAWEAALADVLG